MAKSCGRDRVGMIFFIKFIFNFYSYLLINFYYPILLDRVFSTYFHNGFLRSELGLVTYFYRFYCWMNIFYSEFFVLIVCSLTGTGTTNASIISGKILWKRWSRNDFLYKVYLKLLFIVINFYYPILLDGIFSTFNFSSHWFAFLD